MKARAKAILFQYGKLHYPQQDIDQRDLREAVVGEERGLLGSKAYVRDHEEELDKIVLNINLDMIGANLLHAYLQRISFHKCCTNPLPL